MRVLLAILLCFCYTSCTHSAATCGTSTHTFTDTDISSGTFIQCVESTDLTTYPNNEIKWSNTVETFSPTSNDLTIQNLVTGVNELMCNFTLNKTDPNPEVTTCSFTVTINSLPNLSAPSPTTPIIYPSTETVTCTATGGFDPADLTWEDPSRTVLSNDQTLNFNDNEQLIIGDNKTFVCISVNSAGQTSISITVTVKPNPPTVSLTPQSPSVYIGDPTTLTCSASSVLTSMNFDYSWFNNSSPINSGANGVTIASDELTISDTRTINEGTYRCDVTIYNSEPGSNNTQLTVTSRPPLVTITSQPDETTYTENDMLTLTCVVTPRPANNIGTITITWSTTSGTPFASNDEILTFQSLSVADAGTIMCTATVGNSAPANSNTFSLNIIVPAPTVSLTASTLTPVLGEDVTLTCDVTNSSASTQPVTITWLRETVVIPQQTPTIVITNVSLSDTAGYTCTASIRDSVDTTSNVLSIMVQSLMPQITTIPPVGTVIEGERRDPLDCSATGVPSPDVTWTDSTGNTYNNPLDLMMLTNQMNGTFNCTATSLAGSDSEQIIIIIVPPKPVLFVILSESNPVMGKTFTLTCAVADPTPAGRSLNDYSFKWTSNSSPESISTQQVYTFTATNSTDGMVYTCSASVAGSAVGMASSVALVLQTVPTSIDFSISEVYIGQTRTERCVGTGIPSPIAVIYDPADPTVSSSLGVVDLNIFTESDAGTSRTYICTVINPHGMINISQTFTVSLPSIDISFVSEPTTITKGSAVTLTCSVETDPMISLSGSTYTFLMNEQSLGSVTTGLDGSSATYSIPEYTSDEANFMCRISIQGGRIEVEETLTVPTIDLLIIVAGGVSFVVIILLLALVCLILVMVLCCLRQRKRDEPEHYPDYIGLENTGIQQTAFSYPIQIDNYSQSYEDLLAEGQRKLKEQYQQLATIKGNTEEARKNVNNVKNRYPDVLAYDHSRVIISKVQGTDYINANYMEGFGTDGNAYIAAQGPLGPPKVDTPTATTGAATAPQLNTINDFWRMVWELNISTIVMLTNLIEGNRIKCALYWPEDTQNYGRIRVRKIEESRFCDYVIRKFSIQRIQVRSNDGLTRQVTQFHFVAWPDHGVPIFPIAMIQFVKLVRAYINQTEDGTNAPTLVHCSAGVGRTGTFICLDVILQQLAAGEKVIDVLRETSRLRKRRNYMIQEYLQYEFVHQALNEFIQFGDTECSAADFPKMVSYLHEMTDENPYKVGMSRLELEFKKLQLKVIQTQHKDAKLNENAGKNRFINTMPFDSNRVKLTPLPGIVGSDYINASYIDSDKTHWAFIATQGPLKSTMEDFARMLIEQNSNIIVMLSENSEDKTEDYFSFSQTHYGPFHFQVTRKHIVNDYIHREMTIRDDVSSKIHQIHHFQLTKPLAPNFSQKDCAKALLSLITGLTVTLQPEEAKKGPMVVHCGTGNGMTGVFMTVYIIIQRLAYEDKVDVFNTVKRLRMQRVAMVQSPDQYELCYRAVMEYLQSSPT